MYNENQEFFTDLACERYRADTDVRGVSYKKIQSPAGIWERISITSVEGAKSIGRPMGIYDTLNVGRMDLLDEEQIADARDEIAEELKELFSEMNILARRILVVGLGNPHLTADSLGFATAEAVKPTIHIKNVDESFFSTLECSEIAVIKPGVPASSGLESIVTVSGIAKRINPNAIIAIDAVASSSASRLGSTIQISNTGIIPGGGLGNHKSAINEESTGAPVISIGVPTVMSSMLFCRDISSENQNHYTAKELRGMFVSPKEINEIVSVSAKIIGGGINRAFGLYS